MRKINNYTKFIKESFFGKKTLTKSNVQSCTDNILSFLKQNDIHDWNSFNKASQFKRDTINKLIDSETKNMDELKEVRFNIRLELSNREELKDYLKELEDKEEYEKCSRIIKKLSN